MEKFLNGINRREAGLRLLCVFSLYVWLLIFHPFLHSHAIDGDSHDDCGACIWKLAPGKALILFAVLFLAVFILISTCPEVFRGIFIPLVIRDYPARSPPALP